MNTSEAKTIVPSDRTYVLMTAAHDEEETIEKTVKSILAQSRLPERWVIVSDNSNDRTDNIVKEYAQDYEFIRFLRVTRTPGRSFAAKILALQKASKLLDGASFEFIGNIDADISVQPSYFEDLMAHFERHPALGVAAGFIYEYEGEQFRIRASNRLDSVPHGAQLVRRECYQQIGGYAVLPYGGEDWYAQTCAKMKGWRVQAIPGLPVFHHRHTGAGSNLVRDRFRLGKMDYSFGSDPVFEVFKCAGRLSEEPRVLGAVSRFMGFCWSCIRKEKRPVSDEFIAFLRTEQRSKVVSLFRRFWTQSPADIRAY